MDNHQEAKPLSYNSHLNTNTYLKSSRSLRQSSNSLQDETSAIKVHHERILLWGVVSLLFKASTFITNKQNNIPSRPLTHSPNDLPSTSNLLHGNVDLFHSDRVRRSLPVNQTICVLFAHLKCGLFWGKSASSVPALWYGSYLAVFPSSTFHLEAKIHSSIWFVASIGPHNPPPCLLCCFLFCYHPLVLHNWLRQCILIKTTSIVLLFTQQDVTAGTMCLSSVAVISISL